MKNMLYKNLYLKGQLCYSKRVGFKRLTKKEGKIWQRKRGQDALLKQKKVRHVKILLPENLNTALVIRENSKRVIYIGSSFLATICFLGNQLSANRDVSRKVFLIMLS